MKNLGLHKLDGLLSSSVAVDLRRIEDERASWMKTLMQSESVVKQITKLEPSFVALLGTQATHLRAFSFDEQIKRLVSEDSHAIQMVKQWRESQAAEQESIRRMLEPLQDIRNGLLADSATRKMLDDLAKPFTASEQILKLVGQSSASSAFANAMRSSAEGAIESARNVLTNHSISRGIEQLMKSFEEANKHWIVPQALLNSLAPLQALQEQIGRLSLPVMDAASAATLARMLGP